MSERDLNPLHGADRPRPMPDALRARIEEELLAAAPMPESAKQRVAERLTEPAAAALFEGIDGPRPLPARTRTSLERALTRPPVRMPGRRWLGAAAAVLLLLSAVSYQRAQDQTPTAGQSAGGPMPDSAVDEAASVPTGAPEAGVGSPGFAAGPGLSRVEPQSGPAAGAGGVDAISAERSARSSPGVPPFALSDADPPPAPPPTGAPFKISVVGGDADAVAGFTAYVDLLNRHGGASGRPFQLVGGTERGDARVNLSGHPGAARNTTIESHLAPDRLLRSNTFGVAGALDRQAHLIVDVVYPERASGSAAIYREPTGVLHDDVPAALEAALRAKGVTPVLVDVRPNENVVPVPADAVFLSVTAANAKRVTAAYPPDAPPPRRFNGIATVAEPEGIAALPIESRFISPFAFPQSIEASRIRESTRLNAGVRVYHGWVAAKMLAVAVWRSDPRSPAALTEALAAMEGYANGFAPAFTYRPGTRSPRPEGTLFTVTPGGLNQSGAFLTDPH